MAKRKVTVTIWVDPTEYHEALDTPSGAVDLVEAILRSEADYPDHPPVTIESTDGEKMAIKSVTL